MAYRIRLGGKTRYPRYVGELKSVMTTDKGKFPCNLTHGVKSKNAAVYPNVSTARAALDMILADKDRLTPQEAWELERATVEEF